MVPITTPRRCGATIMGSANLNLTGSLVSSVFSPLPSLRMGGAPLRQIAQRSSLDFPYGLAHPCQLGLP